MGSRQDTIKKRMRLVRAFVTAHLPKVGKDGLGAIDVKSWGLSALLFLTGCLLVLWASMPATYAWAAGASEGEAASEQTVSSSSEAVDNEAGNVAGNAENELTPVDNENNTVNARQTADNSFLYDTSIYELSQADASFQGNTVQIVGEVVGDSLRAEEDPGKYWITLEAIEEEYESSISVLVDEDVLGLIDTYGAYNRRGTTLQVRGTFYLACPSHEGILDVHAESVTLVAQGSTTQDTFEMDKFIPGFVLCGIGVLLALVYRFLRERER